MNLTDDTLHTTKNTQRWIMFLSENTEALKSLYTFLDELDKRAMFHAVQPNTTSPEWVATQCYHKLVLDFKVSIQNVMTRLKHDQEPEKDEDHG